VNTQQLPDSEEAYGAADQPQLQRLSMCTSPLVNLAITWIVKQMLVFAECTPRGATLLSEKFKKQSQKKNKGSSTAENRLTIDLKHLGNQKKTKILAFSRYKIRPRATGLE
jgi:hypothetical protein